MLQHFSDACTELLQMDMGERQMRSYKPSPTNQSTKQPSGNTVHNRCFKITTTESVQSAQFLVYSKTEIPITAVNRTFT